MLDNWLQTTEVFLTVTDGEAEQEYRLTFGTCNNFDLALFQTRRSKHVASVLEEYGDGWRDNDEAITLMNVLSHHAIIMSALKKVELQDGDNWNESKLPDAWYDARRFAFEAPGGLINDLLDAVFEVNPARVFSYIPSGDSEKKALRLTVKPSKN